MDILRFEKRYSRYLRLATRIKSEIESRYSSVELIVHETDDYLVVNYLAPAPGEIFRISRSRDRIRLYDRTACRAGEKDWDTIGIIDLESERDDNWLIEDFFYIFEPTMKGAISRQKRWWAIQKMKMAAEDGYSTEDDELDE